MPKIHLRANKLTGTNEARALCASRSIGGGKNVANARSTYVEMGSEIVDWATFKTLPAAQRCAHCTTAALAKRDKALPYPFSN